MRKRSVRNLCFFEIGLMILGIFAFSFILNSSFVAGNLLRQQKAGKWGWFNTETNVFYEDGEQQPSNFFPPVTQNPAGVKPVIPAGIAGASASIKVVKWGPYTGTIKSYTVGDKNIELIRQGVGSNGQTYNLGDDNKVYSIIGDKLYPATGVTIPDLTSAEQRMVNMPLGNLQLGAGPVINGILSGASWALAVYGAGYYLMSMFGLEKAKANAIAAGLATATFVWKAGYETTWLKAADGGFLGTGLTPLGAVGGLVVGLIVAYLMYSEESSKTLTFECLPWEAPVKGENCENCNSDLYPCSEYRCKSLGQACQILNAGTNKEKCAWINPKDVNSPIIQPDKESLTKNHEYKPNNAIRPPDRGVIIRNKESSDGCIKAFTPLSFGINLNEPAQCKIDYNRTFKYDDMAYYFGDNLYNYNHSQILRLPGPDSVKNEAPELKNDGNYNLYVRCKDANNNVNDDLFVFSFCVEKGPDVTAPVIEETSIANNMPFQAGLTETDLEVYVNEPAECKWSKLDIDYKEMENSMTCSTHVWEMNNQMLYKCKTKLTGLQDRKDNIFYFRCKDQPLLANENDRNTNAESYKFILKGSQALNIIDVKPNNTIKGSGTLATLYLELTTDNGYKFGDSWCSYSLTQNEKDYIKMYETGTNKHKQRLDLPSGEYRYYFQCVDLGGNTDKTNTTFTVEIDNQAPIIVRVYNEANKLKIITDEKSSCSYSNNQEKACNFQISEGTNMPYSNSTEHFAEWKKNKNYYIKCMDINGKQPDTTECSIIVRAKG